jgi:hypothetical protein
VKCCQWENSLQGPRKTSHTRDCDAHNKGSQAETSNWDSRDGRSLLPHRSEINPGLRVAKELSGSRRAGNSMTNTPSGLVTGSSCCNTGPVNLCTMALLCALLGLCLSLRSLGESSHCLPSRLGRSGLGVSLWYKGTEPTLLSTESAP